MRDILSENSKKNTQSQLTELLRLEEKNLVQSVCYFINKIPYIYFKKKNICVQNISSIFSESS
jgi:hypothetical protein